MRSLIITMFCLCWIVQVRSQVSIYDCEAFHITQSHIENSGYEFNNPCVELDDDFDFNGGSNKMITSATSIHIMPGFHAGAYTSSGGMHLKIQPKADFDVAVMNYSNFNNILKYEKFELGVELPMAISEKVNNFVNEALVTENLKLNPYLDWEMRVFAEFTKDGNTPISIDGFYAKEFTSQMVESLPHPANFGAVLHPYYTDEEYRDLGNWTETPTDYPFRIRFAPPELGDWKCVIKIEVGSDVYESPEFIFTVVESGNPGYMKVGSNKRYLSYNNQTFYPIGCNAQWPETSSSFDPELDDYLWSYYEGKWGKRPEGYRNYYAVPRVYDKYKATLNDLIDQGANYFRTIMYPIATEIEWEKLGDYTKRLYMAQELDEILELAESRDVFLHWDLQTHYTFQYKHPAYDRLWTWEYTTLGGKSFCYKDLTGSNSPVDFLTHEESKKFYKQRLRYIVARYGYSTSISVFELLCEISNIGNLESDKNDFYLHGTNWVMYRDWQVEMAEYIKSHYNGSIHLMTANFVGHKHDNDNTFNHEAFDIMTSNIYDYKEPSFSKFWSDEVSSNMLNDLNFASYTDQMLPSTSRNFKPLMFPETDNNETEAACPTSHVERNRLLWESMFSGLAGSLPWNAWYKTENYAIFSQMKSLISQVDLNSGKWHPGASEQFDSGAWFYTPEYADNMYASEKKADLAYLRSGDGNYAIGVMTNKTYNAYSSGTCDGFKAKWNAFSEEGLPPEVIWESPYKVMETVHTEDEGLKLRGMHTSRYYIDYYYPTDLVNPFTNSDNVGPRVKLEVTIPATPENYIVIFKAHRQNHPFLAVNTEKTPTLEELINNESIWQDATIETMSIADINEAIDIEVFPVPSADKIIIQAELHQGKIEVIVESMDGKVLSTFWMTEERKEVNIASFDRGTYHLKFLVNGKLIDIKKVVKI